MSEYSPILYIMASFIPLSIIVIAYITSLPIKRYYYIVLILLSLVPRIFFLYNEPYYLQGLYDIPGHIDYVKYVASSFSLPRPYDCWECHQQPFYYLTASIVYRFSQLAGIISEESLIAILQFYSLFIFYLFLITALLIFKLVLGSKQAIIATSLILFWPSGIIHSVRIGNDVFVYFIQTLALYFLTYWWIKGVNSSLIQSVIFMLLGLLTKTNALVMLPVVTLSYWLKIPVFRKIIRFTAVILLLVTFTMILNQRNSLLGNKQDNWLVGSWGGIPKSSYIGNKLQNFTSFDFEAYFQYPNINPSYDTGGRQYFWIYLIKTSLFGELSIQSPIQQNLAKIINVLMLIFIVYMAVGLLSLSKHEFKFYTPLLLSLFSFISSIIIYRIYFPCPCTNDFRFIYPVLIPILVFITSSSKLFAKNRIIKYVYILSIGSFISLSFLFHILSYITP